MLQGKDKDHKNKDEKANFSKIKKEYCCCNCDRRAIPKYTDIVFLATIGSAKPECISKCQSKATIIDCLLYRKPSSSALLFPPEKFIILWWNEQYFRCEWEAPYLVACLQLLDFREGEETAATLICIPTAISTYFSRFQVISWLLKHPSP